MNGNARQIEFHVLNQIIEQAPTQVEIEFIARLRDETKFASLDDLAIQLKKDVEAAHKHLK